MRICINHHCALHFFFLCMKRYFSDFEGLETNTHVSQWNWNTSMIKVFTNDDGREEGKLF